VFGLRPEPEAFHLVHELAIRSCLETVRPDAVYLHCHHEPFGEPWERARSEVQLQHVAPVPAVRDFAYTDQWVAHYSYAHHADFVRLDVLAEHGGLYADVDTLFVAPIPDGLWDAPFVIGKEADVADPRSGVARPALSNAILMSHPKSGFVEAWRSEIAGALDGTWSAHSCFLANDLAERLPGEVRVEPQRTFHAFEPTPAGIALMLEHPAPSLDGVVSMHLAAHLWWEEQRRDFSSMHAGTIDEAWIRSADVTYAQVARRYLA
jgi:hypothetical protein